jgi:hypothetical protein
MSPPDGGGWLIDIQRNVASIRCHMRRAHGIPCFPTAILRSVSPVTERATEEGAARFGAVSAAAGSLTLLAGTILHPSGADPNVPAAAFAEYAASRSWVAVHLIQLAGIVLLVLALISLSRLISGSSDTIWGHVGVVFAAASLAIAGALQAVDGIALKVMVDRWAAASGTQKEMLFAAAFAVRQIEVGFAGILSLFLGVTAVIYGAALVRDDRFSKWLGWLGVVGGLPTAAGGVVIADDGFSNVAMMINMPANVLLLLAWMVGVGAAMWRMRSAPGAGPALG